MTNSLLVNRARKAERIADFLVDHLVTVDTEIIAALTDIEWDRLAHMAGENTPSDATRAAIIANLNGRRR